MDGKQKIDLIIYAIVVIVMLSTFFGVSPNLVDVIVNFLISLIPGIVVSIIYLRIVESFGIEELLKSISWRKEIFGFDISISAFIIGQIIFRIYLGI